MDTFGAVATAIRNAFLADSDLLTALGGNTGRFGRRMFNRRGPETPPNNPPPEFFPYVVFFVNEGASEDTLSEIGEMIQIQFNIYDYDEDSPDDESTLNDIYDKLDEVYQKTTLTIAGYHHIYTLRGTTIPVPTTDDTLQITVNYEIFIQES